MRVILISILSILVVGMSLLTLRFWGLGRSPDEFDHPWFHRPAPWLILPYASKDPDFQTKIQAHLHTGAIFWIYVYQSKEENIFALSAPMPLIEGAYPEADLAKAGRPLKEVLIEMKDQDLILDVESNRENMDLQISDLVGKAGNGHILIQSEFEVLLRSIKRLQPLWLYGSSEAERVRFMTFDSIGIGPATPFKGDIYVGPLKYKNLKLMTPSIMAELKRRQTRVILGPLENQADWDQAKSLGADGLFLASPALVN